MSLSQIKMQRSITTTLIFLAEALIVSTVAQQTGGERPAVSPHAQCDVCMNQLKHLLQQSNQKSQQQSAAYARVMGLLEERKNESQQLKERLQELQQRLDSHLSKRKCRVELRATGLDDSNLDRANAGHVAINGVKVFNCNQNEFNRRGINLVLFNHDTCTGHSYTRYDTYDDAAASEQLAGLLNGLSHGTVILGVSSDSAERKLEPAKETLKSLGVDVDSLRVRDKVLFIIEKGTSPVIVSKIGLRGGPYIEYEHDF